MSAFKKKEKIVMDSWKERSLRRKIEQALYPARPLRRGIFKGEHPKGRKARLDALLQARKRFFYYLDRVEDDKGQTNRSCFSQWHQEWLVHYRRRYLEILTQYECDGLLGLSQNLFFD